VAIANNKPELNYGEAASLLRGAEAIIDWCEAQLPENLRRPARDTSTLTEVEKILAESGSDGEFPVAE
jgi:hypothetical protein